jgi:hypothetical protein
MAKKNGMTRKKNNNTRKNMMGGARKGTRKMNKGAMKWTDFVQKVHKEMKKKNPAAKLGAAMKEASRRKNEM